VQLFSRLTYAFRRDLYFVITGAWGERSGALKYIDNDLRRYIAVCRRLREACDRVDISADIRGTVFVHVMEQTKPDSQLMEAMGAVIGPALARYAVLEPAEAYDGGDEDEKSSSPLEFASGTIRARRGEKKLRGQLRKMYNDQCAITGECPADLLEVAYIVPFPGGGLSVHAPENALLLRSDLHTLWDLNLIAIDPDTMRLVVADRLAGSRYAKIAGRRLLARAEGAAPKQVNEKALRERWEAFRADAQAANETKKVKPKRSARAEGSRADAGGDG
jgi:hypothetical protein